MTNKWPKRREKHSSSCTYNEGGCSCGLEQEQAIYDKFMEVINKDNKPEYYYKGSSSSYTEGVDPEVTCWNCKKTFLCDCCDATCRLCGAPFDKIRCKEFCFKPSGQEPKECEHKCSCSDKEEMYFCIKCATGRKEFSGYSTENNELEFKGITVEEIENIIKKSDLWRMSNYVGRDFGGYDPVQLNGTQKLAQAIHKEMTK